VERRLVESDIECSKFTNVHIGLILFIAGDYCLCVSSRHNSFCPYKPIEVDIMSEVRAGDQRSSSFSNVDVSSHQIKW
jgi:hypothetical protein